MIREPNLIYEIFFVSFFRYYREGCAGLRKCFFASLFCIKVVAGSSSDRVAKVAIPPSVVNGF